MAIQSSPHATPDEHLGHLKAAQIADDLEQRQSNSGFFSIPQKWLDEDRAWRLGYQALVTLYTRMIHAPS